MKAPQTYLHIFRFSLLLFFGLISPSGAQEARTVDVIYNIYQNGKQIGQENAQFVYHPQGYLETVKGIVQITTSGTQKATFDHEVLLSSNETLLSYHVTVTFAGQTSLITAQPQGNDMLIEVTVSGQRQSIRLNGQARALLLDNNIAAHYEIVAEHLRSSSDPSATFSLLIPQVMKSLPVEAFSLGKRELILDEPVQTDYWLLNIGSNVFQLWMAPQQPVLRVRSPRVQYEARIAGLPSQIDAAPKPGYIETTLLSELESPLPVPGGELPGTLCLPNGSGPFPGVVFVHGSGPNDRNETIGPNRVFQDLAQGLASQGIATYRYDKRTYALPRSHAANEWTLENETIEDAVAAIEHLSNILQINPNQIYIAGHSQGGLAAPFIAERSGIVAGFIVLAGNSRPLDVLMDEQYRYLGSLDGLTPQEIEIRFQQIFADLRKIRSGDYMDSEVLAGTYGTWWRSIQSHVPASFAAELPLRVLILQGERDYQVTMEDYQGWILAYQAKQRNDYHAISYPTLNHMFLHGYGRSNPGEYMIESHVDEQVVQDIVDWIKAGTCVDSWELY